MGMRSKRFGFFLPSMEAFAHSAWRPLADIYRTGHGWAVKFEVPGVRPENIRLAVNGRTLTIQGERTDSFVRAGYRHDSMEICYSSFERHIDFPEPIEHDSITSSFEHGMLLIEIRKERERS